MASKLEHIKWEGGVQVEGGDDWQGNKNSGQVPKGGAAYVHQM